MPNPRKKRAKSSLAIYSDDSDTSVSSSGGSSDEWKQEEVSDSFNSDVSSNEEESMQRNKRKRSKPTTNTAKRKLPKRMKPQPKNEDAADFIVPDYTPVTKRKRHGRTGVRHSDKTPLVQFNFPKPQLIPRKRNKPDLIGSDSDENESTCTWEAVSVIGEESDEKAKTFENEAELITQLFSEKSEKNDQPAAAIEVVVPRDEVTGRKLLAQQQQTMHFAHVAGLLSFANRCNSKCDTPAFRAFSLSVLAEAAEINSEPESLSLDDLKIYLSVFTDRISLKDETDFSCLMCTLNSKQKMSTNAATLVFIAGMRQLGLDVRLVCSFRPISLTPKLSAVNGPKLGISKSAAERRRWQLVSSSDEDEANEPSVDSADEPEHGSPVLVLTAEVFLPSQGGFVFCSPLLPEIQGTLDWLHQLKLSYSVAFHAREFDYSGRSPLDLSARYDESWCLNCTSAERLQSQDFRRRLFNVFRRANDDLSQENRDKLQERDACDKLVLSDQLEKQPKPYNLSAYRHHELYALKRFLARNQVIRQPEEKAVRGKLLSGELIYARDAVCDCYTREQWLSYAKVVRENEKPTKVVTKRQAKRTVTLEMFAPWQVEDFEVPESQKNLVPKNKFGNVELYQNKMLPVGCAHVNLPKISDAAAKLKIDIAPAVIGWGRDNKTGVSKPKFLGHVVLKQDLPALLPMWRRVAQAELLRKRKKQQIF